MMASPKHVLNRLKWEASDASLEDVLVYYRHRGAPDDTAALRGADILEIGRSFLELPEGVRLPHHRILRIERAGRVMWSRAKEQPGSPAKKP